MKGTRADAALYWKAYSQNRLGQRAEALDDHRRADEELSEQPLRKQATRARSRGAARRRPAGTAAGLGRRGTEADGAERAAEHGARRSDPDAREAARGHRLAAAQAARAVRAGAEQAPRAREVLRNIAKGSSTPELQSQAIQYLGVHGGPESRAVLAEVYGATTDVDVKRRILRAFMVAGEKDRLLTAAQTEQNPELRAEAVRQLGAMGANEELWQMYQKEASVDVKRQIIRAMQVGGNIDRLIELAKSREGSRAAPRGRPQARQSMGAPGPPTRWSRSTAATPTSTSARRSSTALPAGATPPRWSGWRARSRTSR